MYSLFIFLMDLNAFCVVFLQLLSRFLAIAVTAVVSNPFILIAVVILFAGCLLLRFYYLRATRDIKRLEAIGQQLYCICAYFYSLLQLAVPSTLICPLLFKVYLSSAPTPCSPQPWINSMTIRTSTHNRGTSM